MYFTIYNSDFWKICYLEEILTKRFAKQEEILSQ